ncbi:MAG: mechanosensitive ion channel family protein [Pseudomonadota bacterium]
MISKNAAVHGSDILHSGIPSAVPTLTKPVAVLCLLLLLFCSLASAREAVVDQDAEAKRIQGLVEELDRGLVYLSNLREGLEAVAEADREALELRRDELGFRVLKDLNELALAVAQLPEDDPIRLEVSEHYRGQFANAAKAIFARADDMGQRIAIYTEKSRNATGPDRVALAAYTLRLEELRIDLYRALTGLIESREALGLPVDDIRDRLAEQLNLQAEILVGLLKFTGGALDEMQARLGEDSNNADLDAAVKQFVALHDANMTELSSVSDLLSRLGRENSQYKAAMLQEGRSLSVRDIEREVVVQLFADAVESTRTYASERGPDLLFKLLVFLLVLLVFRVLSKLVSRAVVLACERSGANMSTLLKDVLASVSGGTVMVIGVLMALSQLGISLGPMLAGLGVAGFIVGFALQDTLGNFAAGAMILLYRPYDVDDFVEVAGASGLVKKMSLVSTTIATFDNQTLVVPNSKIWGDVIKNVTAQHVRRVDMMFRVGYGEDIQRVEQLLDEVVHQNELVLNKPEPIIRVHELGESWVNIIVRPWVKTANYWSVYWDLTREVKLRFDREGIAIPLPQQEMHVVSGPT